MKAPQERAKGPDSVKKRKAGVFVAAVIAGIIVATFIGYNISHMKVMDEEQTSGTKAYTGLN